MIDLGWAMARLEVTRVEHPDNVVKEVPQLVLCWPGDEHQPSGSISIWDYDGLHALRDALAYFLDEYDSENQL